MGCGEVGHLAGEESEVVGSSPTSPTKIKTKIMKEKLASLLAHDKLLHFFVGFILFLLLSLVFNIWLSLLFTSVIAIANEMRDGYYSEDGFNWMDIVFTILPAILLILKSFL